MEPQPPYELTGPVYTGIGVVDSVTASMRALLPVLTAYGIATEEEVDIATFADRVKAELGPDAVMAPGPDLAVWAKMVS
jgi:hypothetical protein